MPFTDFDSLFLSLGIIEILLITIVAFVLGAGLQAAGSALSKIQSDPAFNQMMDNIYDYVNDPDASDNDNPDRVDGMQVKFYNTCKSTFGFNEGFNDWSRLFKAVLAYLESSNIHRGLRIQTLHLLTRGMWVGFGLISVYYVALTILLYCSIISLPAVSAT